MFAHIVGMPIEESALVFAPAISTAAALLALRLRHVVPRILTSVFRAPAEGEMR